MKSNQNGFSTLMAVIVVFIIIVIAGLIVWRVLDTNKTFNTQSQENTTNQQSQQQAKADPNEGYVVIKEWGVRFKPTEELTGVQYFKPEHVTIDSITFTTTALSAASEYCRESSGDIILGLLTRSTETDPQYGGMLAKIGAYTYQYRGPQAACSRDDLTAESKTLTALLKSLESLEAAK